MTDTATRPVVPATKKQLQTIERLTRATGQAVETEGITRSQASAAISRLIGLMDQSRGQQDEQRFQPSEAEQQLETPLDEAGDFLGGESLDDETLFDGQLGDEDVPAEDDFGVNVAQLTAGQHPFTCVSEDRRGPGNSGYYYREVRWRCTEGECEGAELVDRLSESPAAKFRWDELVPCLQPAHDLTKLFRPRDDLPGKNVWIDVTFELYNEKQQPRVGAYLSGPTIEYEPPKSAAVQANLGDEFN